MASKQHNSNSHLGVDSTPRKASKSPSRRQKTSPAKSLDYTSDGVADNDIFSLPSSDWQLLGLLTVVAAIVRLFRIYQPSSVVFDEVHFGGFATKYIKGKFFMDVHPPLAKMLIAMFGWLAGFKGDFDFKDIGKDYLEPGVPYVAMRLFPALCGVLTIPTIFLTLKATGSRTMTATLGAACLIFENGLLTNNRLILLDSPLITATAFTGLAWTCFCNQQELGPSRAFTPLWWFWLVMTGLFLGATASIKWVGLFTIAWVGALTLLQLWVMLADVNNVTPRLWFKHFFARAFSLIVIPIAFYMLMFGIHFLCLVNPGDGDGFMSSEFQSTLNSKGMKDVPADVAFGARVSLRHWNTQGGYLHSHNHMYPEGSKQQQVTLYPHKDENNIFIMENQTQPEGLDGTPIPGPKAWDTLAPTFIEDGATIKLYHVTTDRRLHSHDQRAPVTEAEWQQEVSAYGYEGFEGDANDIFRIEIVKSKSDGAIAKQRVRAVETKFRLVHVMTGCVLFSHKVKLPEWGFEQQEVTCAKGGTLPNSIWFVEENAHTQLGDDAEKANYRNPGFLGKFFELNKVMWSTNAGLTDSHAWDSRPPSWPILKRGINFWGKDHRQIYLIGNPFIWFASTAAIAIYFAFKGLAILRWQRGFNDYGHTVFKRFDYEIGATVLGWACHYLPFFLMQRQLFLHHYFPALYFAIIALCQVYDFLYFRVKGIGLKERPAVGQAIAIGFIAITIFVFTIYAPLAYGNQWTKGACEKSKFFKGWDWDCNNFFESYDQYLHYVPTKADANVPSSSAPPVNAQPMSPADPAVTPQAQEKDASVDEQGNEFVSREEKIEYRDEDGNLLDEEQVAALQGQVSFETKYETRTRLVDEQGNELGYAGADGKPIDPEPVHPPHPDVEGRNPETAGNEQKIADGHPERPPTAEAEADMAKERSVQEERSKAGRARPASERDEATPGSYAVPADEL